MALFAAADLPIPPDIALLVSADAGGDAWVFGDGDATGREYAIHLRRPRLIARLVDQEDEDDAASADTIGGLTLAVGEDLVLCEIRWIDPPPGDEGLLALIRSCLDALERVAARDEA